MQGLIRVASIGYIIYLSALLFAPDPAQLIGGQVPGFLQAIMPLAHIVSFFVLAVLTLSARWPLPQWAVVVVMAIYGGMTEIVQYFLPTRHAAWLDWLRDLTGIALGTAAFWFVAWAVGAALASRQWKQKGCLAPAEIDALQNITSRDAGDGPS
jgi:VanZ family protein